jgi:hypothetical protein
MRSGGDGIAGSGGQEPRRDSSLRDPAHTNRAKEKSRVATFGMTGGKVALGAVAPGRAGLKTAAT